MPGTRAPTRPARARRAVTMLAAVLLLAACGMRTTPGPGPEATTQCAGSEGPWAVAASHGSSLATQRWVPLIAQLGVCTVRGFADDATQVATQTEAGLSLTGILQWSPDGQTSSFPMSDLTRWQTYITRMLTTYPHVDHWEVWNEPPNFTTDTDPAHYARIVQIAYDTAKKINPHTQIGLATKATDIRWLAETITDGAADHFDYLTVHPYERTGMLTTGGEASYMGIVPTIRAMLTTTDPARTTAPIRFTELGAALTGTTGTSDTPTVSPTTQADLLVKAYTMGIAQGAESIAWYDPYDGDTPAGSAPYGLVALDGTTRPAYTALHTLITTLGTRPTYAGWTMQGPDSYAFVFSSGNDANIITWSSSGTTLDLGSDASVTDPATDTTRTAGSVTLRSSPVLIRLTGATAAQWLSQARANAHKPFGVATTVGLPDGGRSATLTPSAALGVDLAGTLPTQTVDGRTAFVMSAQASTGFVVDPAFSAWTTTPVTVTAVVHALSGDPGFTLKYDAAAPIAQLDWAGAKVAAPGWTSITGTGWQTLTWTLPDASFVGMYGFELRLDSDSTSHSGYALASLTISKG